MTVINTAFWLGIHFGFAWVISTLSENKKAKFLQPKRKYFIVSEKEIKFYRLIGLPKWKDKLPQYNKDFDKRNLKKDINAEYVSEFIRVTCSAEFIHFGIPVLGYLSLLFCLFCDDRAKYFWLFFAIATFIGLCNIPFALIQRYNRFRLKKLLDKINKNKQINKY